MTMFDPPSSLEEFFERLEIDTELRPLYRKWLIALVMGKMPERKNWRKEPAENGLMWNDGFNDALSAMADSINTL